MKLCEYCFEVAAICCLCNGVAYCRRCAWNHAYGDDERCADCEEIAGWNTCNQCEGTGRIEAGHMEWRNEHTVEVHGEDDICGACAGDGYVPVWPREPKQAAA